MRTILFSLIVMGLLACNASKEKAILNPSNLSGYFVNIDASKDTIIRTPKGAAIKIQKGTFVSDQELEIKEAYTMKDILLAGLSTESNGAPLRSGGMIYINTKSGDELTLQKPITVILPANGIEEGMELFKGEIIGDSINWVKTDTLQPTVDEEMLRIGKIFYTSNCIQCHAIQKDLTGPALGGVRSRGPWKDLNNVARWINNPGKFMATDAYTKDLFKKYGSLMTSFPQLSEYEIASVIAFVQNEGGKAITDTFKIPYYPKAEADTSQFPSVEMPEVQEGKPCNDTTYYNERDSLALTDNDVENLLDDTLFNQDISLRNSDDLQGLRNGFTDIQVSDGAYRFEIKTLGWYNVDAYVAGLPGTSLCELKVTLEGEINAMNVYAFFPQQKNLSVGIAHGKGEFGFEKAEGKIPLYLGEKATVVAFGNRGNQFYYGASHFTVKLSQSISIKLNPATEEELLQAIKNEKIEGINMDIERQKMKVIPCERKDGIDSSDAVMK